MPRIKKSENEKFRISMRHIINYYQDIRGSDDETVSKALGVCQRTYTNKKKNPDTFSVGELIRVKSFLRIPAKAFIEGAPIYENMQS